MFARGVKSRVTHVGTAGVVIFPRAGSFSDAPSRFASTADEVQETSR
jgi:hypothetical protein